MERDDLSTSMLNVSLISTHTLTWSVTYDPPDVKAAKEISTHTLTWSVTQELVTLYNVLYISTHTLTWSVTTRGENMGLIEIFQLTRSRGA